LANLLFEILEILADGKFHSGEMMAKHFNVSRVSIWNAIAKAEDGTIIDIFNGVEHINEKILITPLDPIVTFMDDPLRTLRALRFSITKGFKIHPDAWDAMFQPGLIDKMEEVVST
jgi:CO dehydrogenase nickel-insertion accessory protein CooC1